MKEFPRCPECGKKLIFFKCVERDEGSKYKVKKSLLICNNCQKYYILDYNNNLIQLNPSERIKLAITDVVKENCGKELNEAQKKGLEIFEKILKDEGEVKGIFSLPTGVGKTLLAACIIRYLIKEGKLQLNSKILVLAPRRILLEQIVNEESDFYKMFKDLPIIIAKAEEKDTKKEHITKLFNYKNGHIIVATPQLINEICKSKESFYSVPIVLDEVYHTYNSPFYSVPIVLDEVHHTYNGPKISESIKLITTSSNFVIGLSATPTKEAVDNVGKILYYYPLKNAMNNGLLTSKIKFYKYSTSVEEAKYIDTGQFCEDPWKVAIEERAKKYAEQIFEVIKKENKEIGQNRIIKTAVACPNTVEADILYENLRNKIEANHLFKVHYKQEEKKNDNIIKNFKKDKEGILVCVNMIDIGFDDSTLEMLVIARPLKNPISYVQLLGRVLRKPPTEDKGNIKNKKNYAIILDLADNIEKYQKEYDYIEKIEKGEIEAKDFEEDLKGPDYVKKATARVSIIEKGIDLWLPRLSKEYKPSSSKEYKIVIDTDSSEEELEKKIMQYKEMANKKMEPSKIRIEYEGEYLNFINFCKKHIINFDINQQIRFYFIEKSKRIYYIITELRYLK